jgi:hypothetical protein
MRFTPVSEAEAINLLPEGVYDFVVKVAEEKISKKGHPMIKVTLSIYDNKGVEKLITDYLMEAMMFKLIHFCQTTGLYDKFQEGNLEATDLLGATGKVKIRIEEDETGMYDPKNAVRDYVKPGKEPAPKQEEVAIVDDEIPF